LYLIFGKSAIFGGATMTILPIRNKASQSKRGINLLADPPQSRSHARGAARQLQGSWTMANHQQLPIQAHPRPMPPQRDR
jgi:hypothetical protein